MLLRSLAVAFGQPPSTLAKTLTEAEFQSLADHAWQLPQASLRRIELILASINRSLDMAWLGAPDAPLSRWLHDPIEAQHDQPDEPDGGPEIDVAELIAFNPRNRVKQDG